MNQTTIFRSLVVASIALAILGGSVDFLVPGLVPEGLEEAYSEYAIADDPTMSQVFTLGGVALLLLVGTVAGTIGLLLFKPWGRLLSLCMSALGVLSYPFLGPALYSGWATMLTETSMMLWGAALGMAYFADVKVRFERSFA